MTTHHPSRFWPSVNKTETCWLWTGPKMKSGRGRYGQGGYGRYNGRAAHRVAYELEVGPIPDGMTLDHLCGVTACVRPDHLEPVTTQENTRRYYADVTHCKNGHEFTPENTYLRVGQESGRRGCRACNRAAVARYKARRDAA